jgi:hypothetical protein
VKLSKAPRNAHRHAFAVARVALPGIASPGPRADRQSRAATWSTLAIPSGIRAYLWATMIAPAGSGGLAGFEDSGASPYPKATGRAR